MLNSAMIQHWMRSRAPNGRRPLEEALCAERRSSVLNNSIFFWNDFNLTKRHSLEWENNIPRLTSSTLSQVCVFYRSCSLSWVCLIVSSLSKSHPQKYRHHAICKSTINHASQSDINVYIRWVNAEWNVHMCRPRTSCLNWCSAGGIDSAIRNDGCSSRTSYKVYTHAV